MKRRTFLSLMGAAALTSSMMLTGCGAGSDDDRKIVRIGHVQSQTHPCAALSGWSGALSLTEIT